MKPVRSTLYAARKGTGSLKTTMPKEVVAAIKLQAHDDLEWVVVNRPYIHAIVTKVTD